MRTVDELGEFDDDLDDDDDDDDESDDDFGEVESDATLDRADDLAALSPCPHCGKPIHEEAQKCDHCGQYVTSEFVPARRPWWLVVGVVAGLFAVYLWIRR